MSCVTLVVKSTRLCNLHCKYCHDFRTNPGQVMPFRVMARMTASILQDAEYDDVTFLWHGGEPTLLPIDFFRKALLVESRFRRNRQIVRNALQTNATLLNNAWVEFLRTYKFSVSVSLDGPSILHNRNRLHLSGRGSYDEAMRGINLLRQVGIKFGVLMVVDRDALEFGPERIFDFFVENGISDYGLLAATPENHPSTLRECEIDHYVPPQLFNSFLIRLYEIRRKYGDPNIRIRELDDLEKAIRGSNEGSCKLLGGCFGHFFVVEPNGEVAHCDLFLGDSAYMLGNILYQDFSSMRSSDKFCSLIRAQDINREAMSKCPEFSICHGWCPHEGYLSRRHNKSHQDTCCGLHDLIRHIRSVLLAEAGSQMSSPNSYKFPT